MAIQYVGGTTGAGTGASYTVSLSGTLTGGLASSPSAGDLIVVFAGHGNTAASAPTCSGNTSGSYVSTVTAVHANDTWDTEFGVFHQWAGATPDTTLTIGRTNNTTHGGATVVMVFRGARLVATSPAATTTSGTNGAAVNPPSITPTESGSWVVAGGTGMLAAADTAGMTAISNLTTVQNAYGNGSTADASTIAGYYDGWTSGAFDPAAATGGNLANGSSSWAAASLVLLPEFSALSTNTDNFDANASLENTKWNTAVDGTGTVTNTGGEAVLTPEATNGFGVVLYSDATNGGRYTLTSDGAYIKVVKRLKTANTAASGFSIFRIYDWSKGLTNTFVQFNVTTNNELLAQTVNAGTLTQSQSITTTWDADATPWLRISINSGTITWWTASGGSTPGTWTSRHTNSPPAASEQFKDCLVWFQTYNDNWTTTGALVDPFTVDGFNTAANSTSGSHASTGALAGPGAALAGSAARTREHASSGAPTGPGSQAVGAAAVIRIHATSGALTGPGSTVAGSAHRTLVHDTSGAATGAGSTVAGSANRAQAEHAASGTLTAAGSAVAGAAARTRAFAASGALAGPGAAAAGSAARLRVHDSSGTVAGPGSTTTGSASRSTHATSGALAAPGAVVAGTASRTGQMNWLVAGQNSLVAGGDFLFSGASGAVSHDATGALVGVGAVVAGTARNSAGRRATGGLVGSGAALSGASSRSQPGHFFSGVLAPSFLNPAVVTGAATRTLNTNKTYSIQDTFDAASIDTAKWDVITIGAATGGVSQTASCLEINQTNNTLGTGFMVRTDSTKDFAGSYVYTRLVNGMIASNNADGAQVEFGVLADVDSGYMWLQRSNGTLVPHWKVAGTPTDGPIFAYTPSTHGWLRVKEDGGTVSWQHAPATASDPPADHEWITDHTRTRAADGTFAISAVRVRFATFMSFGTPGVPTGPVRFDSVNIRTKSVVTHACTGALAGPDRSIVGLAARRVTHAASGVLAGPGAITVGAAKRGFEHTATGALSGSSAIIISNGSTSDVTRKLWIDTQDTAGAWSDKPQSADPWTDVPVSGGTWGS